MLNCRIDEDEGRNPVRSVGCEEARGHRSERMSNNDQRTSYLCGSQQTREVAGNGRGGTR
jgi:hypothetical protein